MDDAVPILLIVVVLPLWMIFHYITKWKSLATLKPETEASFGDLHRTAERLERRLRTLERILDDEVPDWRKRHHEE